MKKWLMYFLTPGNTNSWDLGYLMWIALIVEFAWKTVQLTPFDPVSFGTGSAALLAAGAGLQWHANREDDNHEVHSDATGVRD